MLIFIIIIKFCAIILNNNVFAHGQLAQRYTKYTMEKISQQRGNSLETHKVVTTDGYILTLHRIHFPSKLAKKNPVLIMHGLMGCSMFWMFLPSKQALPLLLARAGYDVWLGNARGVSYSLNHTHISKDSLQFWDFSFSEIGKYDLPAMIDYILRHCKRKKLHYIGHSQGTTSFFAMASELNHYNKKIKSMHALSPIVYFDSIKFSLIQILGRSIINPGDQLTNFSKRPIFGIFHTWSEIVADLCKFISDVACYPTVYRFSGIANADKAILPAILETFPENSSIKCVTHYLQMFNSKMFRKFDYGTTRNSLKYGKTRPPEYNLSKVFSPIFLYYSRYDDLLSYEGGVRLSLTLPKSTVYLNHTIPDKYKFNHADFVYGKNVRKLVYDTILANISVLDNL